MIRGIIGLIVLVAVCGFYLWASGPGLIRDFPIHQGHYEASDEQVTGQCHVYAFVLNSCEVAINRGDGAPLKDNVVFFDTSTDSVQIGAVHAAGDPSKLSTTLSMEKFWNRIATLIGLIVLLLVVAIMRLARGTQRR